MTNIFRIWESLSLELPFFVQRSNWSKYSLFCVVSVLPKVSKNGLYGKAYGYYLNVRGGYRTDGDFQELSCAGCYNWISVPSDPKRLIDVEFFGSDMDGDKHIRT